MYYGESVGISVVSIAQFIIRYENLNNSGPPFTMNVQIGGEEIASVVPWAGYIGNYFEVEYLGVVYCGQFASGTINLS